MLMSQNTSPSRYQVSAIASEASPSSHDCWERTVSVRPRAGWPGGDTLSRWGSHGILRHGYWLNPTVMLLLSGFSVFPSLLVKSHQPWRHSTNTIFLWGRTQLFLVGKIPCLFQVHTLWWCMALFAWKWANTVCDLASFFGRCSLGDIPLVLFTVCCTQHVYVVYMHV